MENARKKFEQFLENTDLVRLEASKVGNEVAVGLMNREGVTDHVRSLGDAILGIYSIHTVVPWDFYQALQYVMATVAVHCDLEDEELYASFSTVMEMVGDIREQQAEDLDEEETDETEETEDAPN